MHVTFRGVNDAFRGLVQKVDEGERGEGGCEVVRTESRNGPVLKVVGPVIVTFTRPRERVLFNRVRDQNPFFILYEGLHMLAGRNDIAPLTYYASRMSDYSDDGITLNGAYGHRWRHAKVSSCHNEETQLGTVYGVKDQPIDQLKTIIEHLKLNPTSRRVVLQMWNVKDDLMKIGEPVGYSKDVCCNVCVMFSTREETHDQDYDRGDGVFVEAVTAVRVLDMTVINRSNDLVWGLLGGDMVHFSMLQEYVAAHLGVEIGVYHQITNDLHVYTENNSGFKPQEWLSEHVNVDFYLNDVQNTVSLVKDPATFDRELTDFVGAFNGEENPWDCVSKYEEPFLQTVAGPMLTAFRFHKQRDYVEAMEWIDLVRADDWKIAGRQWIEKRRKNWENKNAKVE